MEREMQRKLEARTRAGMLPHNRERIMTARYRIEGLYAICELCDAQGIIVESLMIEQSKLETKTEAHSSAPPPGQRLREP